MKRLAPKSIKAVEAIKKPGIHPAGQNLYVKVGTSGGKSWVYRFFRDGARHNMGLGPCAVVSMAEAREKLAAAQALLRAGTNPIDQKHGEEKAPKVSSITFGEVLEMYLAKASSEWKPGAAVKWRQEAEKHLAPLMSMPVAAIGDAEIMAILSPAWTEKMVTLSRVRGKAESVLSFATAAKFRTGENPARWKGHLEFLLARPSKAATVKHVAALGYEAVPGFLATLRTVDKMSARAAEFAILTAARSDEVRFAKWSEISDGVWSIPGERMKMRIEHKVPLSGPALALLERLPRSSEYVFPGASGAPLGHAASLETVKAVSNGAAVLHGFRSDFSSWAGEATNFARDVVEKCLAHAIGNETERAYRRGEELGKRLMVLEAWARYVDKPVEADNVLPMQRQK